jgi:cytochrome P450
MGRGVALAWLCVRMAVAGLARSIAANTQSRLARRRAKHAQFTDFDPFDPAIAADPYPHYRKLLQGQRVHYNPKRDVYILGRHADVRAAARDDDTLSSARGATFALLRLPFLTTSDPPAHTRLRKQLKPAFTKCGLESWRPMIDQIARELVAELLIRGHADVVSTVSAPMPVRTITHVLGVPASDEAALRHWSEQAVRVTNVNFSISGLNQLRSSFDGFRHLYAFFTDTFRNDELLGEETVLGMLAGHAKHGRLSGEELFFFALLLLLTGYVSTTHLLSTLFLTLAEYPDQLRLLQRRPELIPSAIEEQLRFASPIQSVYRTTRADYSVGPAVIPAGARVLLAWGAANRDPRQFDDPDVFRADRSPGGHLAFGSGIHSCPGTQLGRMQGQAVLREIVDNIDRIEVVEPPRWSTNANTRGLTRLQVSVMRRAPTSRLSEI